VAVAVCARVCACLPASLSPPTLCDLTCVARAQEANEYAADNDLLYMETSAKDSHNVQELFTAIGELTVHVLVLPRTHSTCVVRAAEPQCCCRGCVTPASGTAPEAGAGAEKGRVRPTPAQEWLLWINVKWVCTGAF
jgi:hypothetical protein